MKPDLTRVRRNWARARETARTHPERMRALATVLIVLAVVAAFFGPFLFADADARHLSAYDEGRGDVHVAVAEIETLVDERDGEMRALATSPYFLESLEDPSDYVLFVFGVERPYTPGEAGAVLDFVDAGGTLVLGNDVVNGNAITREVGVLFTGLTILDAKNAYLGDPNVVEVDIPLTEDRSYRVLMNSPAYMTLHGDAQDAEVLAWSSDESYADVDGNGRIDMEDQAQAYPLAVRATHGDGRVLVLADSQMFTNELMNIEQRENAAFARGLAAWAFDDATHALVDESRHTPPPSAAAGNAGLRAMVLITSAPVVSVVVAGLALAGAIAAVILKRDTEDWSVHEFDIGHERAAPRTLGPTPDRIQDLARRAVSENYNIPVEYLQSASFDELVRLTGDEELVAVATGKQRAQASPQLYEKLTRGARPKATPEEA